MDNNSTLDEFCEVLGIRKPTEGIVTPVLDDDNSQSQTIDDELSILAGQTLESINGFGFEEIIIDSNKIDVGDSVEIEIDLQQSAGDFKLHGELKDSNDVANQIGPLEIDNSSRQNDASSSNALLGVGQIERDEVSTDATNAEVFNGSMERKRKSKSDSNQWKRNINKFNRMKGQSYLGFQNTVIENEQEEIFIKPKQNKVREAVKIGPTCSSKFCKISKKRHCQKISEDDRKELFGQYWNEMTWSERKVYIVALIDKAMVKIKTTGHDTKRKESLSYFLKVNDQKVQVCKFMFMSTLKVTTSHINEWIKQSSKTGIPKSTQSQNRFHNKKTLKQKENSENLKLFLNKLPKMPSHYTRKDTSKLYLEPIYNSVADLFWVYKKYCEDEAQLAVSRWKFDDTLAEMNISLFQPKKDQCDTCTSHKNGNLSDSEFESHLLKKDQARREKDNDKERAIMKECHVLTMDLESVKVAPYMQASALYYKTKLAVHNFTVYNLATHHATCYWWNESESELVASAFASCLVDYMTEHCTGALPIIVYSDGCTYQNRNAIMSNALLCFSMNSQKIVTQKYLEKGHTQMECDSVHSAIECKLKNKDIYLPSDYYKYCKEARKNPYPYEVKSLTFDFFRDYSRQDQMRYKSIRPGKKVGDSTVTDMRALKYTPEGTIFYKLDFQDDWKEIPIRPKPIKMTVFPSLYNENIKIKAKKYQDLQDLKKVLPSECHSFYDNLHYI